MRASSECVACPFCRRHLRAAAQSRAAQLAHEPSRFCRAALLAARPDQHVEREEHEAEICGGDRRYCRQRSPGRHAPGRRRVHVHLGSLGRGVQNRCALRHSGADRLEDGSRPGASRPQPRRRALGQPRDLRHLLRWARNRHRQGDRPHRLGQESARSGRSGADRSAPCAQGFHRHRRLGRRSRTTRLDRRARCEDRQSPMENLCRADPRRARQRDVEGQEQCLADRRRRLLRDRFL